ncbi:uncharacterized protein N7477_007373 [Penicillium maclennaniae]|uniref:uncharacterized protein n=1 Tax=Penicillium maclennaniae TaxID=1343394 RepID=UPI00254251C3|nr:uncharacterized protein N7477_007373 [Penicillium maclennaniae]KAJ5664925.1 hypothetical protein N7477_007373 [Penicillium maclennaniae]
MIALLARIFTLATLLLYVFADREAYWRSQRYKAGHDGPFPVQRYSSKGVQGPILNYWQRSEACSDGYVMLAPRGPAVRKPGPMILDSEGHLVWFKEYDSWVTLNLNLNSHYEQVYKIDGVDGLDVDIHEFQITQDDTAVFIAYAITPADLRDVGGLENGWIWDGIFVEVDVESNEILFEWRASEHFAFTEVERDREGNGDSEDQPWDFFHINSVDKDEMGSFLVSSRYMNSLAYVDGQTGEIIWKLGGKRNSFVDLSGGAATNFSWQHHARFQPDYSTSKTRAITIFDNSSRGQGAPENPSRGLFIDIDERDMTASVRHQYWNPLPISSQSQGSVQILDNGNVLVGYGSSAAYTEFAPDGEVLCEVHFGSESSFNTGQVMSYRVFKQDWLEWGNGGEDVGFAGASLRNQTRSEDEEQVEDSELDFILAVPKSGFETVVHIPDGCLYTKLRIVGLDKMDAHLGASPLMDWEDPEKLRLEIMVYDGEQQDDPEIQRPMSLLVMFGMGFLTATVFVLSVWLVWRLIPCCAWRRLCVKNGQNRSITEGHATHSGEELNELDELSDLEFGERAEDPLLKREESK